MPPFAVAVIANAPLFTNRWEKDIQLGPSRQQNRLRQLLAGTRTRRTVECLNPRSWPWVCQASSLRDSHIGTSNRPLLSSKPPTPSCHLLSPPNVVPETVPSAAVERSFEQNSNALSHSEPFWVILAKQLNLPAQIHPEQGNKRAVWWTPWLELTGSQLSLRICFSLLCAFPRNTRLDVERKLKWLICFFQSIHSIYKLLTSWHRPIRNEQTVWPYPWKRSISRHPDCSEHGGHWGYLLMTSSNLSSPSRNRIATISPRCVGLCIQSFSVQAKALVGPCRI